MSYDLEIGTHLEPRFAEIADWAAGQELAVERNGDGGGCIVSRPSTRGDSHLFALDGPFAAEPDDFAEEVAAACLAPRWMTTIAVPYSVPKRAIALARSLARHLAETNDGAAFDPQEDSLIWPRGRPKRVQPRRPEETTSVVGLEWFLPTDRWEQGPATLLRAIRRRCPEALPRRYGRWEPGGSSSRIRAGARRSPTSWSRPPASSGRSSQWPKWIVTANNRLYSSTETDDQGSEHFLRGRLWQGLPPVPVWLSWFGGAYRDLVAPHLTEEAFAHAGASERPGLLRLLRAPDAAGAGVEPQIEERAGGLFVRLGDDPRPLKALGAWPLPAELTYRLRPPYVKGPGGSIISVSAQPEDAAEVIPPLSSAPPDPPSRKVEA